jgi:hypothetical protein
MMCLIFMKIPNRTHSVHKLSKLSIWLVYYFRLQLCSRVLHWMKDSELQTALSGAAPSNRILFCIGNENNILNKFHVYKI